jgi:hypothetical protein
MFDNAIIVAIVGFAGVLVGGLIQAATTRGVEARRFERESKWDLYSKYFLTLGELSFSNPKTERHHNALSLMAQLRGRIGVVGSSEVIEAVGNVFRHPDLHSEAAQEAMAIALAAMRSDVGGGHDNVSKEALTQLMFGSREDMK